MIENFSKKPEELGDGLKNSKFKEMSFDFWVKVAEGVYKNMGQYENEEGKILLTKESKLAQSVISELGLPSGQYSSLMYNNGKIDINKSKNLAKQVTNISGLHVYEKQGEDLSQAKKAYGPMISFDIRDYYINGLTEEIKEAMSKEAVAFIENEFLIQKEASEGSKSDYLIYYNRLSNGSEVILRGYAHDQIWHKGFEEFLTKASANAEYISIEGNGFVPFGKSLQKDWSDERHQKGDYDRLMKQAIENGFKGYFVEFDQRVSKVGPDPLMNYMDEYSLFLRKINPNFKEITNDDLEDERFLKLIRRQSWTTGNLLNNTPEVDVDNKKYLSFGSIKKEDLDNNLSPYSTLPTGLELGRDNFADALSALKIHMMDRLMSEDKIKKGLMVDYQGAGHTIGKSFYLKYPEIALMTVFQTLPYLMIQYTSDLDQELQNPSWEKILIEIGRLPMGKVDAVDNERNSVEIGENQRSFKMLDNEPNIFTMLGVDINLLAQKMKLIFEDAKP